MGSPQAKANAQRAQCEVLAGWTRVDFPLPTTVHTLHTLAHTTFQRVHSPRAGHVDLVAGLSELLFSDPWVGQMEEGRQEARVGEQLGLQQGCGLAVLGPRLTSVWALAPPSLQREQPWRRW